MKKSILFPIFLVFLLDNLSYTIVYPLFSTIVVPSSFPTLSPTEFLVDRTLILGLLNTAFPLGLLFGAPITGNLSDHFGRKPIFLIAVAAITLANFMSGLAFQLQSFTLLLISRAFCGFFSTNLTLCMAIISDLNPHGKARAAHFGMLTAIGGVSWLLAMLIGIFSSNTAQSSHSLPFWIISGLGIINLFILYAMLPETRQPRKRLNLRLSSLLFQMIEAFRLPHLRPLFVVQCLFMFSWFLIFQWFSGASVFAFGKSTTTTNLALTFIGLFWIIGAALLNRKLIQNISLKKILYYGLFSLSLLLFINSFVLQYLSHVAINCLIALIASLAYANLFTLISFTANKSSRGEVIGFGQSVIALAQLAAPLAGAFTIVQNVPFLYRLAAGAALLAFLLFYSQKNKLHSIP